MAPQETSAADGQLGGRAATIRATDMHRVTVPHDAMIHTLVQSSLCAHYNERAPHPPTRTRSGRNSATAIPDGGRGVARRPLNTTTPAVS